MTSESLREKTEQFHAQPSLAIFNQAMLLILRKFQITVTFQSESSPQHPDIRLEKIQNSTKYKYSSVSLYAQQLREETRPISMNSLNQVYLK